MITEEGPITIVLLDGDVELASWRVRGLGHPDVEAVGALARIQLIARRFGWSVRLRHAPGDLRELAELLDLLGLRDALGGACEVVGDGRRSVLEPRRQAELGEQLGREEVVEPGDPAV